MLPMQKKILLFSVLIIWSTFLQAMVYDNRYFPLYPHTFSRHEEKRNYLVPDVFFMLAHNAIQEEDDTVNIPNIWGPYDLKRLAEAGVILGLPNVLEPDFTALTDIIYDMNQTIDAQGFSFAGERRITEHFWIGGSAFFMHLFSRIGFSLSEDVIRRYSLTPEQVISLDARRRELQTALGFKPTRFSQVGFSDIDLYVRLGKIWEYHLKFRRIDLGLRGGLLINSGLKYDIDNPASLPFGGDGFFGLYFGTDTELEIKEDWIVGLVTQFSKRLPQKRRIRIPVNGEQPLFGAAVGELNIDPGLSVIINPYIRIEDIRDGLGGQLGYTGVVHYSDAVKDARLNKTPPALLAPLNEFSEWNAEYVNVYLFYDFSRVRKPYWYAPIVELCWDMPTAILFAKKVSKTQRFSFGLVLSF